jgi:hypothetical protein
MIRFACLSLRPPVSHRRVCPARDLGLRAGGLDGVRPRPELVTQLRALLHRERELADGLRVTRRRIVEVVLAARHENASYFSIAATVVPATCDPAVTLQRRHRVAANLKARVHEARRRTC